MFEMSSPPQLADEQSDIALSQINPEDESHVLVPHWQSALFGVVPSVTLHDDLVLQILIALSQ